MNEDEFEFDGFNSKTDMGLYVAHINKPVAPSIANSRQPIPAAYGDINLGTAYGAKTWTITVQFLAPTPEDYNEAVHNLANYLIRDTHDGSEYSMIFGDEPDVEYYGVFTAIPDATQIQETVSDAKFDLTFVASDPKGYLPQETIPVDGEPFIFTPKGTGECYPIYYVTPHDDVFESAIALQTDEDGKYIDVGYAVDPTETDKVVDNTPVIVSDPCNTLATWVTPKNPPFAMSENIAGSFDSNTNSISVKKDSKTNLYDYGDPSKYKSWFGPMLLHEDLTDYPKDFILKFRLHHRKGYARGMSKNEIYLVGPSQERVGRVYIQDESRGAMSTLNIFLGPEGKEVQVCKGMHFGPKSNKKEKKVDITIVKKGKKVTKKGKGKKGKAKTTQEWTKQVEKLTDFNNTNYFNNCFLEFAIKKVGLQMWLTVSECDADGEKNKTKIFNNKMVELAKDADFALRTIAFYAPRWPITEDTINPQTKKPTKTYNYGFNSITNYSVESILDGASETDTDDNVPKIIAHKGDTIIFNTETHHVTLSTNGGTKSLDPFVSFGSDYPPLMGGVEQTIGISPNIPDADVIMSYRPTYI